MRLETPRGINAEQRLEKIAPWVAMGLIAREFKLL